MIFLDRELYLGFVRLQADTGLGRSFAGLLPFVEELYHMGYINREVYTVHVARYSHNLVGEKQLTLAETQEMEKNIQLGKFYRALVAQWKQLSLNSRNGMSPGQ
jgi:hypothetical protein